MASSTEQTSNSSVSQLLSTLIPNLAIFAVFLGIFVILRKKQVRVYEPRSQVSTLPKDLKPEASPRGAFSWIHSLLGKSESFLIQQTGADGYFFARYLFEFAAVALLGCFITWPILFPINATNSSKTQGLDRISISNISNKWRVLAHIFLSWIFFGAVIFLIYRELVYYTTFRHVLQTTPLYDSLLSSRTLLLTEIPDSLLEEANLRENFPTATNVWYARDYEKLEEDVKERKKLAAKYEGALNKVVTKAVKLRNKAVKKNKPVPEPADDLNKYLKDGKKRPTHRLKFLIGKKVDTLDYGVERLGELNKKIKKQQLEHGSNTQVPSVFIEFPTQLELQKAYQAIPYNPEFKGAKRFNGISPDDVIWENLALTPNKRRVKKVIASTILTLMIIFWCVPVAVVGAISNINNLTDKVHFLRFINNMPKPIMGVITGLLPTIALAILMSLVPPFIKKMGKVCGCITVQQVEAYCQSWFYAFQIVNVFIVVTVTSAAASAVTTIISDPTSALTLLAQKIPASSNFYISYFCLQGLTISSGLLLQMVALILAQFLGKILDSTPRAKWNRYTTLGQPAWSVIYPAYQLLTVIALVYSIIAPLILGFSFIAFVLIYIAYLYTLVYVMQPNKNDARGRNYPRSLFQLFVGLYLAEVCLVALFVFQKNWVAVGLEGASIVVTAAAHIYFKLRFLPLFDAVPISAIKYAAGDSTFTYPQQDQGLKEIKVEGENYWQGGNQLGLTGSHRDQVLPPNADLHALEKTRAGSETTTTNGENKVLGSDVSDKQSASNGSNLEKQVGGAIKGVAATPGKSISWLTRFFNPSSETFDLLRSVMPAAYYNYIEYNPDFIKTAYEDPAVTDDEPHIWVARDDLGLSEIEKNKALENGVDVSDENAGFDEKGSITYTGPPPSYEEALKI
ncbi:DUF221-domain-containing protein [Suhomyces tanzawaensis NRRL Y-17324]|uniref:DUF221-domain-containing protein n=1 Tax=Suhomyces tanzawaensis NRRL Y-17324 TaxID=984487 RepID=A0A1E4SNR5_9ASCO|nr:DUF221-domain-containing protein [Suhomyces tanzawaensis NRRL Y-17324]ODV81170.1 DUF221-domain-containing protein [Suhomyces tanzawaensis NRRL Y-17324]